MSSWNESNNKDFFFPKEGGGGGRTGQSNSSKMLSFQFPGFHSIFTLNQDISGWEKLISNAMKEQKHRSSFS